jgi:hypothetical protein
MTPATTAALVRVVFVQTLFRPLQHLGVPHSPLPPRDKTETQNSVHASPYNFRGELVPICNRERGISARSCVYSVNEIAGADASKKGPNENGMNRGAWKSTVDMTL